mmetsp:Transcript_3963/g.10247  ORF Transcript_3963/g.10247 Transcript_3963/m.10247 type:complete len:211 (-) Transcript_3963:375-1007(-)
MRSLHELAPAEACRHTHLRRHMQEVVALAHALACGEAEEGEAATAVHLDKLVTELQRDIALGAQRLEPRTKARRRSREHAHFSRAVLHTEGGLLLRALAAAPVILGEEHSALCLSSAAVRYALLWLREERHAPTKRLDRMPRCCCLLKAVRCHDAVVLVERVRKALHRVPVGEKTSSNDEVVVGNASPVAQHDRVLVRIKPCRMLFDPMR